MTKSMSHSHESANYSSIVWHDSESLPGVRYATRRISLMQRIELTSRVRELVLQHEFLKAGDVSEQLDVTFGELLVRKLYIEWGLDQIQGFTIDGEAATAESVIEKGPEELSHEIAGRIRTELELSVEERKNS